MAEESKKDILQCGEKELQKLRERLQQSEEQKKVLNAFELRVRKQQEKLEQQEAEIDKEIKEAEKTQRLEIAKPYNEEITALEAQVDGIMAARAAKREEEIRKRIKEETQKAAEKKRAYEKQLQEIIKAENIPDICTSKAFLACFFPKSFTDVLILLAALLCIFAVLPCAIYFGLMQNRGSAALSGLYLVITVFFYTGYLLVNNLVKEKYMVSLKKINTIRAEKQKLEQDTKRRLQEIEKLPDSALNLTEFEEDVAQLQQAIEGKKREMMIAVQNFDSDTALKNEMATLIRDSYRQEMESLKSSLEKLKVSYMKKKEEADKFKQSIVTDKWYEPLANLEKDIFKISVVDEMILYMKHGGAETIAEALVRRKTK